MMEKYPTPHPCTTCLMQQRAERYQYFWDSRNTKLAMGLPSAPLTGLAGCQNEIREIYCEGCRKRRAYLKAIEDPDWRQYPQDDNFYTPQYETVDLFEIAGVAI